MVVFVDSVFWAVILASAADAFQQDMGFYFKDLLFNAMAGVRGAAGRIQPRSLDKQITFLRPFNPQPRPRPI